MAMIAWRRATMAGPTANVIPSSSRAAMMPERNSVFAPMASESVDKGAAGNGAVGAGGERQAGVFKFAGQPADEIGAHGDVGVAHGEQIEARRCHHVFEAPDLCVRPLRLARRQQPRRYARVFRAESLDDGNGRVGLVPHGEQKFEVRVLLLEKRAQQRFQVRLRAVERLEDGNRRHFAKPFLGLAGKVVDGDERDDAINRAPATRASASQVAAIQST
jgi:hypothetical protein